MDNTFLKQMTDRAAELVELEFKQIEQGVPACFRSNPGGTITVARKKELIKIIDRIKGAYAE